MRIAPALRLVPLALACAALTACSGGGTTSAPVAGDAVAAVGARAVPVTVYDRLIQDAQRQYVLRRKAFPQPGTPDYAKIRDTTVSYLVHIAEIEQKAAAMGIDVTPAEVTRGLNAIKASQYHGSEQAFTAARLASGLTEADIRENERVQLLTHKLYGKVTGDTTVADAAVGDYYDVHANEFWAPDRRTVRHVLVRTRADAEHVLAQLKAGESFERLERTASLDEGPGRFLMPISKGDTVPGFEKVAFKLKIGQLSQPIKTTFGWHIVQALSPVRPSALLPLATVKNGIRQKLVKQRRDRAMDQWLLDVQKLYCSGPERVRYAPAFAPSTDPCKALAKS
jgi:parvulin-like peptidyl-prolyl isomerase